MEYIIGAENQEWIKEKLTKNIFTKFWAIFLFSMR